MTWFCDKKILALRHPLPLDFGAEVWSVGQKSRFIDLRWGSLGCCVAPKIFGAASYRVTWPGRKNLGVGCTFPTSVGERSTLNCKMTFFEMTRKSVFGQLDVGVRRSAPKIWPKKNFRPWRCFLIPWSVLDDKNSSIYRNLESAVFYFRSR